MEEVHSGVEKYSEAYIFQVYFLPAQFIFIDKGCTTHYLGLLESVVRYFSLFTYVTSFASNMRLQPF